MGQVPRAPSTSHQGSLHFLFSCVPVLPYSLTCPPSRWAELPADACPLPLLAQAIVGAWAGCGQL